MRLVLSGAVLLLALFNTSRALIAQQPSPSDAENCRRIIDKGAFESKTDGSLVSDVGYSNAMQTCIVIREQEFPAANDRIEVRTEIIDSSSKKTIWADGRTVPPGNHADDRYRALDKELKKLDIHLARRTDR